MWNTLRASVIAVAIMPMVACGPAEIPPALLVETGCVTASEDKLILTGLQPAQTAELEPGGAEVQVSRPVTEAYLLLGEEEKLRAQVGREVRVTGEIRPGEVTEIRGMQPMARARPAGGAPVSSDAAASEMGVEPAVDMQYALRLEVGHMLVRAIEPTGETCE